MQIDCVSFHDFQDNASMIGFFQLKNEHPVLSKTESQ